MLLKWAFGIYRGGLQLLNTDISMKLHRIFNSDAVVLRSRQIVFNSTIWLWSLTCVELCWKTGKMHILTNRLQLYFTQTFLITVPQTLPGCFTPNTRMSLVQENLIRVSPKLKLFPSEKTSKEKKYYKYNYIYYVVWRLQ